MMLKKWDNSSASFCTSTKSSWNP